MNLARSSTGSAGQVYTAALAFGGGFPPDYAQTETWNGTNWTEVNDLNLARRSGGGFGTNTSAIYCGGIAPPSTPDNETETELWNGTNWTEVNDLNEGRRDVGSAGVSNSSGMIFGGNAVPSHSIKTESWNGTNWTELNDMNTIRLGIGGSGDLTAALAFGGEQTVSPPGVVNNTEEWNGTNWTEVNDLNVARMKPGFSTITGNTAALAAGGHSNTTQVANVEEWSGTGSGVTRTFTDS
jgi:hypothetical protein